MPILDDKNMGGQRLKSVNYQIALVMGCICKNKR